MQTLISRLAQKKAVVVETLPKDDAVPDTEPQEKYYAPLSKRATYEFRNWNVRLDLEVASTLLQLDRQVNLD